MDVVVLDRGEPGSAASSNNAGWVVPIMAAPVTSPGVLLRALVWLPRRTSPLGIAMSFEREQLSFLWSLARNCSRGRFEQAAEALADFAAAAPSEFVRYQTEGIAFERHDSGILMMFRKRRNLEGWESHLSGAVEGMYKRVTSAEAAALQPAVKGAPGAFALCEGQARVDPRTFVTAVEAECRRLGVDILGKTEVTGFERAGSRVRAIRAGTLSIEPDVVVLSAGAWTGALCKHLEVRLPIRPGKGYGFDVRPLQGMSSVALYLSEARVNLSPLDAGLRVSGVMEFGGLDTVIDSTRANALLVAPQGYLRGWPREQDKARPWVGLRPMTPDGLPCIGWLDGYDNVLIAAGHALFGVTLAPATAKALTDCVTLGRTPARIAPFRPARFDRARAA